MSSATRSLFTRLRDTYRAAEGCDTCDLGRHVLDVRTLGALCELLADSIQTDTANDYMDRVEIADAAARERALTLRTDRDFRPSPVIACGPVPHHAVSEAVKARLATMTTHEARETFVRSGIIDADGNLMPLYRSES